MARPVSAVTTFNTLASGVQPATLIDGEFANVYKAINDPASYANYAADAGTVNTIVANLNPAVTALVAGLTISVKVLNTNTGATTLNANGTGAFAVVNQNGGALVGGQFSAGGIYSMTWNGASWVVTSFASLLITNAPPAPTLFYWT